MLKFVDALVVQLHWRSWVMVKMAGVRMISGTTPATHARTKCKLLERACPKPNLAHHGLHQVRHAVNGVEKMWGIRWQDNAWVVQFPMGNADWRMQRADFRVLGLDGETVSGFTISRHKVD